MTDDLPTALDDLSDREHDGQSFEGVSASAGGVSAAYFDDCTFRRCDLERIALEGCEFSRGTFQDCSLSLASVPDTRFAEVVFRSCKLTGIDWTEGSWPNVSVSDLVTFDGCTLDYSAFMGLRLPGTEFRDCSLVDVDFSDCDLSGANFAGSELSGARFATTDLRKAHLEGAVGYDIDIARNDVTGMTVSLPEGLVFLEHLGLEIVEAPAGAREP